MIVNDVKIILLGGIQSAFSRQGFILNKNDNAFTKKYEGCVQTFYLKIFKEESLIYIEPKWGLKIDAILDVYNSESTRKEKSLKNTYVLGNGLGELIDLIEINGNKAHSNMLYLVENDSDIDILIKIIPKRFEEYVLPYFNENSTIERVDKLLNSSPKEAVVHNWLYPLRACIGVIAAKLVDNPNYFNLVNIYREELTGANLVFKIKFENIVTYLNK